MMTFLAIKRFNYIDSIYIGTTVALCTAGSYFSAAAVFIVGCVVSAVIEQLTGANE